MDLAASIQAVTEEAMLADGPRAPSRRPGMKHLVLAGGVALNCVANGRLLREGPFDGYLDSAGGRRCRRGARRGAVRLASAARQAAAGARRRPPEGQLARTAVLVRTRFAAFLDGLGAAYQRLPDEAELLDSRDRPARRRKRWSAGFRAGWSSVPGRSAPAASSAIPRSPRMQATMNLKIKFRESFRPFAPCVLQERGPSNGSTWSRVRRAPTCCSSRRSSRSIGVPIERRAGQTDGRRSGPAEPRERRRAPRFRR